jgi:hypothetical protein
MWDREQPLPMNPTHMQSCEQISDGCCFKPISFENPAMLQQGVKEKGLKAKRQIKRPQTQTRCQLMSWKVQKAR